jgi:hypothetical protein
MNRKILAAGIGAAAILAAVPASAQDTRPMGLSVRAGIFFPTSDLLRDNSRTLFIGGAEYKIKDLNLETGTAGMRTSLTLSADYIGNADFRNIPVLLNLVGHSNNAFYYSVGAGIGFTGGLLDTGTTFSYQLGIGYDFQQGRTPLFLEGHYFGAGRSDANGFAIMVGIRL